MEKKSGIYKFFLPIQKKKKKHRPTLMNKDAEILIKIFANWIQGHIEVIIYHLMSASSKRFGDDKTHIHQ